MRLLFILPFTFLLACSVETPPPTETQYSTTQTETGALERQEEQLVTAVATVAAVDPASREITLKDPRGNLQTFDVSPQVKRLPEVKVGDKVVTKFYESLAFEVREPTAAEIAAPRQSLAVAGKANLDLPPGMAAGKVTKTIVRIVGIDVTRGTVTLKLPEGNRVTIRARVPENLKRVRVGDTVAVTYSRALAVTLDPYQG